MPSDRSSITSNFAAIACIVLVFLVLLGGAVYGVKTYLDYKTNQKFTDIASAIGELDASYTEGSNPIYLEENEASVADILPPLLPPNFTTTAPALAEEFVTDQAAATEKYDFQIVRVDGRVVEVGKGDLDIPFVVLEGHDGVNVSIGFPAARNLFVEKIQQGDHVVLQGTVGAAFSDDKEISLHDGGMVEYAPIIESDAPQP